MKLSNLSVGLRLGASFGAILLITALIAATGMWRIASLQGASERVATQEIEQQTLVENWASDIRLNWVRTEAFLKAIDRDYMEKLTADTQATAKGIEGKVQRIEGLVQGDKNRAQLATIAAASKAYNDKLAEIRELHRGGEPNVPTLVDKDLRPLADKYLQSLDGQGQPGVAGRGHTDSRGTRGAIGLHRHTLHRATCAAGQAGGREHCRWRPDPPYRSQRQ